MYARNNKKGNAEFKTVGFCSNAYAGPYSTFSRGWAKIPRLDSRSPGEILCKYGARSDRLFVLVAGKLEILAENRVHLAVVCPVNVVGEMGFITRKPRSATVRVQERSRILTVDYRDFRGLIERDVSLQAGIYHNMIRLLCERLSDANDLIVRYRNLYELEQPVADQSSVSDAVEASEENEQIELSEEGIIRSFYRLTGQDPEAQQLDGDRVLYQALRQDGYCEEDIVYAIKWTVRHIPAAKRFNMVKLSIQEALEDRWSV